MQWILPMDQNTRDRVHINPYHGNILQILVPWSQNTKHRQNTVRSWPIFFKILVRTDYRSIFWKYRSWLIYWPIFWKYHLIAHFSVKTLFRFLLFHFLLSKRNHKVRGYLTSPNHSFTKTQLSHKILIDFK